MGDKMTKEKILKNLLELEQTKELIKNELKYEVGGIFSIHWNWSNKTSPVLLTNARYEKHRQNKTKLAKDFLKLITEQIKETQKLLK